MGLSKIINQNGFLLNALLEYFPGRVILFDKKFRCLYENSGIKNYYEDGALVDFPAKDNLNCFYPNDEMWIKRGLDVFSTGKAAVYNDKVNSFTDGPSESVLIPVIDDAGDVNLIILMIRQVTERRKSRKEPVESKFAELGEAMSYITHELKAPLNSIALNIESLHSDISIPTESKGTIAAIRKELKRLNTLLRDTFKFPKTDIGTGKNVHPKDVINNVMSLLSPMLKNKNISYSADIDDCIITGNESKLTSVFYELLTNAADAIGSNGFIKIYSCLSSSHSKLSIYMEDSGCGITEADKIFIPFYSTKPEGTGIGLSQVSSAMQEMNAEIKIVSSAPGKTLFELVFNLFEA